MIDTHSHIYLEDYDTDRAETLERAWQAGVTHILCPAVGSESHERLLELCRDHPVPTTASTAAEAPACLAMMGVHPTEINDNPDWRRELAIVEKYLAEPPVERFYAVGEIGIDLHWSRDFLSWQIEAFECQLDLALRYDLPVAIHSRDAWPETLEVLARFSSPDRRLRGVMHAFSGGYSEYQRITALGDFVFGVGGPVTYKKNLWPELLPRMLPGHIVLETDAPWLSPVPLRGRRNEPAYLMYIRAAVAAILGFTPLEVDALTTENARRIFDLR